jgi:hypothetical protein
MAAKPMLVPEPTGACMAAKPLQEPLSDHEPLAMWYRSDWDPRLAIPQLKKLAEGHAGKTMFAVDGAESIIVTNNPQVQTFLRRVQPFEIDQLSEQPEGQVYARGKEVKCGELTYLCF